MLVSVNPFLSFNGTCEAAFNFYKSVFGGEFDECMRYKDKEFSDNEIPASDKEKIAHISLQLTEHVWLMGTDVLENFETPATFGDCVCLSICAESEEETQQIYNALSAGGTIEQPLEKTSWADLFASFTDKFGICWSLCFIKKTK
jgi:PhnB protein